MCTIIKRVGSGDIEGLIRQRKGLPRDLEIDVLKALEPILKKYKAHICQKTE